MVAEEQKVATAQALNAKVRSAHTCATLAQQSAHDIRLSQEEAKLLKENLDEQIMRYKAMESTQTALSGRRLQASSMKTAKDDAVTQLAQRWFALK